MTDDDKVDILVVDDLPDKLLAFRAVLDELDQNLCLVSSGADALRELLRRDFAVILLDVNMPDIDGIETAELIRQHSRTAHTPIIFVTAYADEMQTARGYELGAVDYILSPIVPQILRSKVRVFVDLFGLRGRVAADGSQFDRLWRDGERFALGSLDVRVLATPGHTCDSLTYLIGRHAFVGDTIFRASYGTARCDFPGGDADALYGSISRLYALPADTVLHFCHDYPPVGHEPVESQTVAEERARNVHVTAATSREQFTTLRRSRDAALPVPALLIPAVQVNIAAGRLPVPDSDGRSYLRMPLNSLRAGS